MQQLLFDDFARKLRRERAARMAGDLFLHRRAFDDCVDRLTDIKTTFTDGLIVGVDPSWSPSLSTRVARVTTGVVRSFAPATFDLCISIGEFEATNDIQSAAFATRHVLRRGGLLLGTIVGGNSLPRLRAAMLAADRITGVATPRVHPSIDGPSLAALLTAVGFVQPVVDLDRVDVAYPSLDRLIGDLRSMGCTNVLTERTRKPLTKRALEAAVATFQAGGSPVIERFELLHFAAWTPQI